MSFSPSSISTPLHSSLSGLTREGTFVADPAEDGADIDTPRSDGSANGTLSKPKGHAVENRTEAKELAEVELAMRDTPDVTLDDVIDLLADETGTTHVLENSTPHSITAIVKTPLEAAPVIVDEDDDDTDEFDFVSLQDLGISSATLSHLQQNEPPSVIPPRTPGITTRRPLGGTSMDSSSSSVGTNDSLGEMADLTLHRITTVQMLPMTPYLKGMPQRSSDMTSTWTLRTKTRATPLLPTDVDALQHSGAPVPKLAPLVDTEAMFAAVTDEQYSVLPRFITHSLSLENLNIAIGDIKSCILATEEALPSEVIFTMTQLREDLGLQDKAKPVLLVLLKTHRLESRGKGDDGDQLYSFKPV
jgi:hypothetical protein